ncbi:S8 family serine peptidase [Spiroplasma endosymbiont of Dioctria linearis]|uniref:S8 family serine peptidase n=1 Tax=Spiroplasma endosymbiont of Dioctria linearis TaxID=3066290 RepID=UPI00313AEC8F
MKNNIEFFKFSDNNKQFIKNNFRPGGTPKFRNIKLSKRYYYELIEKLEKLKIDFQKYSDFFENLPISIKFNRLLNKGDRFKYLFKSKSKLIQIDSKYQFDKEILLDQLEITYLLNMDDINGTIRNLNLVINFLRDNSNAVKRCKLILEDNNKSVTVKDKEIEDTLFPVKSGLSNKTRIKGVFEDTFYLVNFWIYKHDFSKISDQAYVRFNTIKNSDELIDILSKKNIKLYNEQKVIQDGNIYNLDIDIVKKISDEFPFLINLATNDRHIIDSWESHKYQKEQFTNDEIREFIKLNHDKISNTYIGVIDSHGEFQESLSDLIDVHNDSSLGISEIDYSHGTAVSSLIVLNDLINNKGYKDGLGIFKVKHFGIIANQIISQSIFLNKISKIIKKNSNIKIWNLSTQILFEFPSPRISELGRQLDLLQKKYKILIIIASGNEGYISIGGDSILSLTVGSLFMDKYKKIKISSYSGKKKIFNLFDKPNAYEFGNDLSQNSNVEDTLWVIDNKEGFLDKLSEGTSYAAPLLARKCAYLMDQYNFSIDEIKSYINACNGENEKILKQIKQISVSTKSSINKKIIIGKTRVKPGYETQFKIFLPFREAEKKRYYRAFLPLTSISYLSNTDFNVGDEYSSTEVELKLHANCENNKNNLLNKSGNKKDLDCADDNFKTQHSLISKMKKYNPNKVLEDELFAEIESIINNPDKMLKPLHLINGDNKITVKLTCSDLFDNNEEIEVGYTIFLYEIGINSLANFEKENEKLVERVQIKENLQEKSKIKV